MPTYEYECRRCHRRFEFFQSMTEPPRKRCPACRGGLKKLLSTGAGLLFKGSGFYTTDYRSEGYKKAAKAESSPPAKEGGKKEAPAAAKKEK
jgi:putative FmdB family regulatory protein